MREIYIKKIEKLRERERERAISSFYGIGIWRA